MLATQSPFPFFADLDGSPLDNGDLYFGEVNQNPITNPVEVYWDSAGTQPAAQPVKVMNGYAVRAGTPALIFAEDDYSLTVKNSKGSLVFHTTSSIFSGFGTVIRALGFETNSKLPGAFAQFYSREDINAHARYAFLDDSSVAFSVGLPPYGHASFNSNVKMTGSTAADHHHSFQSYPHIEGSALIDRVSGFYSIGETLAGTVTQWSHFHAEDPTGGGTVTNQYGVYIAELTQGSNNWGIFHYEGKSFFGGAVHLGSQGVSQATIEYDGVLGHLALRPRNTYGCKIEGGIANGTLLLGAVGDDSSNARIENAADGRLKISPRSQYGVKIFGDGGASANGTLQLGPTDDAFNATIQNAGDGKLKLTARTGYPVQAISPLELPAYVVASLPAAASYQYSRVFVSDATATTFNSIVAGGGANKVPVWSDGTNWRIG